MLHQKHQSAVPQEVGHVYLVNPVALAKQFASILLIVLALFLAMWIANGSGILGKKYQLGDPDSTIISTKVQLAATSSKKRIAFVGDSSCLVNIHIPTMKENGIEAINLGTLSYLGIDSFGLSWHSVSARTNPMLKFLSFFIQSASEWLLHPVNIEKF